MGTLNKLAELQRSFVAPPRLATSRPRPVQLTAGGRALVVFAIVLFAGSVGGGLALFRDAREHATPIWLPFLVSAAAAAMGLLCLLGIQKQRRLLTEGRAAPAIVTSHHRHHTGHGGTHLSLTYEFPLLNGAVATGRSQASRKPPAVGSVICVIYDPDSPARSMAYPFSLVQPAR